MKLIRIAKPSDAAEMLEIYAPYILNSSITFETEVPPTEVFAERIAAYLQHYPWLVCEIDGKIAGYAYASTYRERIAYQWSLECSVYVHDGFMRLGVADALYSSLIAILKLQGFTTVYAVINLPNDKSVGFHEKLGFVHFADYKNVGYKSGKWKTVGWWLLQLNEYVQEPEIPVKFSKMDQNILPAIFETAVSTVK
jgi:L-amino acid N-acyltransferase YncA